MGRGAFRFIDLFCGIGGMRLGLEQAGGRCIFSSEINKYAIETYERNFHDRPDGDVTKIRVGNIPDHDVLAAGFPCQPFSIAGVVKRASMGKSSGFDAPQGSLFNEIVRILRRKRPRAFILENVKYLRSFDDGRAFAEMLRMLEGAGYVVRHDVIDARCVVPQHRERLFIVGFDHDAGFEFPEIGDTQPKIRDILEPDPDGNYVLTPGVWKALKRHKRAALERGAGFGYGIADPDGTSRTLSRRYYKDGAEILIDRGTRRIPRRLTPRECARLMGFPESFVIPVSDTQAYRQFGNAVVPAVVAAIGDRISKHLRKTPIVSARPRRRFTRRQRIN